MVKFSTLIAVIALVCASILPSGSAHFECYNASGCGSPINHVATVSSIRDCCLGRRYDGLYYSNDGGPCTECIVYGFDIPGQPLDTPTFTAAERGWPQYSLPVRMIKGSVGSGLDINAEVQPGGTADQGHGGDFFMQDTSVHVTPGSGTTLQVTFRLDDVALEPDETFTLQLFTNDPVPTDENYFFVDTLRVTIQDVEGISIRLSEVDYSVTEGDKEIKVRVHTEGERYATPVTVRVTPMNYDDYLSLGRPLPIKFPDVPVDPPYDSSPNRAKGGDFSSQPITVTLPPSDQFVPVIVDVPVAITDDVINEAEEVFVVILELVAAQNPDKVDLNVRNVSLCTIGDNDPISIGFEFSSYTYTESEDIITDATRTDVQLIYLVASIETEQTFNLKITATSPIMMDSGVSPATHNYDYHIGSNVQQHYIFSPGREKVLFGLGIFDDDLPERTEVAQLVCVHERGWGSEARFTPSVNGTATLFFQDDKDEVVVTMTPPVAVVTENVGAVEFCLTVTVPGPDEELIYDGILVILETKIGTADETDFVPISSSLPSSFNDNTRSICSNVTIIDDRVQEYFPEVFFVEAHDVSLATLPVRISPPKAYVVISDND